MNVMKNVHNQGFLNGGLKWAIQVSNQGHPACKAGALPLS